ncbi:MAG: biopolymer transporter ExbD [Victivallaceae bacterium]
MKINYQLSNRPSGVSGASLASMIDIIFLLIIFFVITASFDREQIDTKISLPQVNSGIAIKSLPSERLMINVSADGSVKVGFHTISIKDVPNKLGDLLYSITKGNANTSIIVNGDCHTKHRYVSAVLDAIAQAGYSKVQISALISGKSGGGS